MTHSLPKEYFRIIAVFVLLVTFTAVHAQWSRIDDGMDGGYAGCFAKKGSDIYVGTTNGVYVSKDNGATWSPTTNDFINNQISAIAVSGANLIIGTGDGAYVSQDNGMSWRGLSFSNSSTTTLFRFDSKIYAGTRNGVFYSADDGMTWSPIKELPSNPSAASIVTSIVSNGTILFVSYEDDGIFKSSDKGLTWTSIGVGFPPGVVINELASDGTNLFAATDSGIYLSDDNGTNWNPVYRGLPAKTDFQNILISGSSIYASNPGLYQSVDNGSNWTAVSAGIEHESVIALFNDGSTLFAGTFRGGVYTSSTLSPSWTKSSAGLRNTSISALTATDSKIFAGKNTDGNLFISSDNGAHWDEQLLPYGNYITAMAASGSSVYAGGGWLFLSTDDGSTWRDENFAASVTGLTIKGQDVFAVSAGSIKHSTLGQSTWSSIVSPADKSIQALATDGTNLYAGAYSGNGALISSDNGASWTPINNGFPNNQGNINAIYANDSTLLAYDRDLGLLRLGKGGSWTPSTTGLPDYPFVTSFITSGKTIFIKTSYGVFLSNDDGNSWSSFNLGLPANVTVLCIAIYKDRILAGTQGQGVWSRSLNENTPPIITAVTPDSGKRGTVVTITGSGFDTDPAKNLVQFNTATAHVTASSPTTITATVPIGAETGLITVTVNGLTGTSKSPFIVLPGLTSFDPISGIVGTAVIITGTGFDPDLSKNIVKFNGVIAVATKATTTTITTTVPEGATTGPITIETNGVIQTGYEDFTVMTIAGIKNDEGENLLYPNPVKDYLFIQGVPTETEYVIVSDMKGNTYKKSSSPDGNRSVVDTSGLPDGVYIVKFFSDKKKWVYAKFLKN